MIEGMRNSCVFKKNYFLLVFSVKLPGRFLNWYLKLLGLKNLYMYLYVSLHHCLQ